MGIPVYKLKQEMPYTELLKWVSFFKARPVGWRDDQRTFMLLKAQGAKGNSEDMFPALRAMKIYSEEQMHKAEDDTALPKGKFLDMMLKARNGDGSGWKPNR